MTDHLTELQPEKLSQQQEIHLNADGSNVESYRRIEMRKLVDDLLLFSCMAAFAVGIVVTIASLLS
jgi:hypothetical protein